MKQMYNLRLVAADALDLLVYDLRDGGDETLPQRLQTSMSLYSTSLSVRNVAWVNLSRNSGGKRFLQSSFKLHHSFF